MRTVEEIVTKSLHMIRDFKVVMEFVETTVFGIFRRLLGNLRMRQTAWWAREDSNLQPDRYERSALTS